MKKIITIITILFIGLTLVSCSSNKENTITVAASPKPHGDILRFAGSLLKEKGFTLKVKPYSDFITPNTALTMKQVDANFFQHEPYLNDYNIEYNTDIISLAKIHIEPIGIYSKKYKSLEEVKDGATVLLSESTPDHPRLLALLINANLITLKDGVDVKTATIGDIKDNYKNLVIRADIAPATLPDVYKYDGGDLVLINSNYALAAGLNPGVDAIALEEANNNPFANIIATIPEYKDLPKIKALVDVLTSKEVAQWILDEWNNDIVPVVK